MIGRVGFRGRVNTHSMDDSWMTCDLYVGKHTPQLAKVTRYG